MVSAVNFDDLIMSVIRYDEAMESSCQYQLLIEIFTILHMILYQSTKAICDDDLAPDMYSMSKSYCINASFQRTTISFALLPMNDMFLWSVFRWNLNHEIGRIDEL